MLSLPFEPFVCTSLDCYLFRFVGWFLAKCCLESENVSLDCNRSFLDYTIHAWFKPLTPDFSSPHTALSSSFSLYIQHTFHFILIVRKHDQIQMIFHDTVYKVGGGGGEKDEKRKGARREHGCFDGSSKCKKNENGNGIENHNDIDNPFIQHCLEKFQNYLQTTKNNNNNNSL